MAENFKTPADVKICNKCGEKQTISAFSKGRDACKACVRLYWDEWRSKPENVLKHLVSSARGRAKKKGIPFNITYKDLTIPKTCPVFGIPIIPGSKSSLSNSPSIDRFIPELGYTKGNVQIISMMANQIKGSDSIENLRGLADWIYDELESRNKLAR